MDLDMDNGYIFNAQTTACGIRPHFFVPKVKQMAGSNENENENRNSVADMLRDKGLMIPIYGVFNNNFEENMDDVDEKEENMYGGNEEVIQDDLYDQLLALVRHNPASPNPQSASKSPSKSPSKSKSRRQRKISLAHRKTKRHLKK